MPANRAPSLTDRSRRVRWPLVSLLVAALVAGCGGIDASPASPPAEGQAPAELRPDEIPEDAVITAFCAVASSLVTCVEPLDPTPLREFAERLEEFELPVMAAFDLAGSEVVATLCDAGQATTRWTLAQGVVLTSPTGASLGGIGAACGLDQGARAELLLAGLGVGGADGGASLTADFSISAAASWSGVGTAVWETLKHLSATAAVVGVIAMIPETGGWSLLGLPAAAAAYVETGTKMVDAWGEVFANRPSPGAGGGESPPAGGGESPPGAGAESPPAGDGGSSPGDGGESSPGEGGGGESPGDGDGGVPASPDENNTYPTDDMNDAMAAAAGFLRDCEMGGWQSFQCSELLSRMNGCPPSDVVNPIPDEPPACEEPVLTADEAKRLWSEWCSTMMPNPDDPDCSPIGQDARIYSGTLSPIDAHGPCSATTQPGDEGCYIPATVLGPIFGGPGVGPLSDLPALQLALSDNSAGEFVFIGGLPPR